MSFPGTSKVATGEYRAQWEMTVCPSVMEARGPTEISKDSWEASPVWHIP